MKKTYAMKNIFYVCILIIPMIIGIWRYCSGIKSWSNIILLIFLPFLALICKLGYDSLQKKKNKIEKYAQEQRDLIRDYNISNNKENINLLLELAQETSNFNPQENQFKKFEDYLTEKYNLKPKELETLIKENISSKENNLNKSLSYLISGDYKNALFYLNKVLEHSSDLREKALAYSYKGDIFLRTSKLNESKNNLLEALYIFQNNREFLKNRIYAFELGKIYGNLGIIAKRENNLEIAISYYNRELNLFENLNEQFNHQFDLDVAQSHQKIYALYSGFNKPDSGYSNLIEAEKLLRGIDQTKEGVSSDYANNLNSLGLYYANKNAFEKAHLYFFKALNIAQKIKNEKERLRLMAFTFSNMAQKEIGHFNLDKRHSLKNALEYFKKAKKIYLELKVYEDVNIEMQYSQCLGGLGTALKYSGKYEESEKTYKESIEIKERLVEQTPGFNNIKLADIYLSYAMLLNKNLKRYNEAKEYAQKAIENYKPYLIVDPSLQHWINEAQKILD